ncbi:MAG: hypothetical protein H7X94_00145 [Vallitaleaceae bacterium]|nr:hypothetical protein [Vallitaleaceae bacterium]
MFTPKQRMINAYRGIASDRFPVAPEFWYLLPAKVLGVSMLEFEREIPFWQALKTTFTKYGTEGWGAAFPELVNPNLKKESKLIKIGDTQYRDTTSISFKGKAFQTTKIYDLNEPSWVEHHLANDEKELSDCIDILLSDDNIFDFANVNKGHAAVGEDYLLEMWMGTPFFDFIAETIGFEKAVMYFFTEEEVKLEAYRQRYIEYQKNFIRKVCANTAFESFAIGCSYSCNSLIGPNMWRQWDKPYIQAMADEIHRHGKLLHIHFHGRSMEAVSDFAEIGIDCVCPFERGPGGDIDGLEGLKKVRELLQNKVTMNGNVHTVETLIRGTQEDVRREVRDIKEAFKGSARLIIGTGDQVGRETPEENIWAMIEEAKK